MTAQIDPLQLKIQTQLLQAMFMKNMAFLKQSMPAIYAFYQSYTPQTAQLAIDNQGAVNLSTNNQFFYLEDPKQASIKQVEAFIKKPIYFDYTINKANPDTMVYEHQKVNTEIVEEREKQAGKYLPYSLNKGEQINTIAFIGTGLGFHIDHLFNQYQIRSILIFEPSADVFYAMLHCVDVSEWFNRCQALGGRLTFKIGGSEQQFINDIYQFSTDEGAFNLVQMYLYRHYFSDKTKDTLKLLGEMEHRFKSGWGFCEDEIIGITHTLQNIEKNGASILLEKTPSTIDNKPVFIIGNGPSLDDSLAYLKENQENAIIISSGTSLKPLLSNGIIPDLHVEQERPKSIEQWVKKAGHEEVLKSIPLICLNTVAPGILSLFNGAYVALKAGDVGSTLVKQYLSNEFKELYYSNPTVTNTSTAIAVALGFKTLYLFGVDYGFRAEGVHHAQGSIYQDIKDFKLTGEFKAPANFGGEVITMRNYDHSRGVLEMLLEKNPDVKCVNTSDGMAINLTTACRFYDLPSFSHISHKSAYIKNILSSRFKSMPVKESLDKQFSALLPSFAENMAYINQQLDGVSDKEQLVEAFAKQFNFISLDQGDKGKVLFKKLFSGSLNYLQANILDNVSRYKDKQACQQYIGFCILKMREHLDYLIEDVAEHYNKTARV